MGKLVYLVWIIVAVFTIIVISVAINYIQKFFKPQLEATPTPVSSTISNAPIAKVTYKCAENKKVDATYFESKVSIVLSDGRKMDLPQAMSGSGARYANTDERFVFWNKGNTAFIEEGGKVTYKDCNQINP